MKLNLSEQDHNQIREHGLNVETVQSQLQRFSDGIPFSTLERACTINDGINHLNESERSSAIAAHSEAAAQGRFMKMVPASGAASRMFKTLLALHGSGFCTRADLRARAADGDEDAAFGLAFFDGLTDFAFYPQLDTNLAEQELGTDDLLDSGDYSTILYALLDDISLNMAEQPKGLIAFHWDGDDIRTPVAEHLLEAIETVAASDGTATLHFTVSPEHEAAFKREVETAAALYPDTKFTVEFSHQSPSTDTIAADMNDQPFRDEDGRLLFRPGGHGALLKNLNELQADLVFIKNVDNVLPPSKTADSFLEKRVLGGYAVQLLATRDEALHDL
ncbi:MAG TPA: DUF4301 family protein, partial [Bacteroidetes bacterium]|nr:DUF4301 family protein [Bacteroidota bacterium]HEX05133.1 DUF4301 family protein [Bacteroidota bacterium]